METENPQNLVFFFLASWWGVIAFASIAGPRCVQRSNRKRDSLAHQQQATGGKLREPIRGQLALRMPVFVVSALGETDSVPVVLRARKDRMA
jgi:hypothetical protein